MLINEKKKKEKFIKNKKKKKRKFEFGAPSEELFQI